MNNQYKVALVQDYQIHDYILSFRKDISLPFVPFIGLSISDDKITSSLIESEMCSTYIIYDMNTQTFTVFMKKYFKYGMSSDLLANVLHTRKENGWIRVDSLTEEQLLKMVG